MRKLFNFLSRGIPVLINDLRAIISAKTPFFVAVPRSIYVDFGNRCNAFCTMCPIGRENRKGHPPEGGELREDLAIKLLKEVKELSGRGAVISLTGGEPLLYPPLYTMMDMAQELKLCFSFTTNGYLLDEERVEKIARANPFGIGVSIESLDPAINELMRPYKNGEGTKITTRGIDLLLKARRDFRKNFRINIKTVITKANMASYPDLVRRFGKESGVLITPQPYLDDGDANGDGKEKFWIRDAAGLTAMVDEIVALKRQGYNVCASEDTLKGFIRYFQKGCEGKGANGSNKQQLSCLIGNTTIFVNANGDIKLCPYMKTIGNLGGEITLKEIWQGEAAKDLRRKIKICTRDCELSCTRNTSLLERFRAFLKSA